MRQQPSEVVAIGIIRRESDGRILIARRPAGSFLGGLWEFPGGKVEAGESPADALVREMDEELGIRVEAGRLILDEAHRYPDRSVRLLFFECRILGGQPRPRAAEELVWCEPGELGRYAMPEGNRGLLKHLRADASEQSGAR